MEKITKFRDYQEQQAEDHNDLQKYARSTFDHLILDAVTETRRYAGFGVTKTSQAEIQIAPGRFYDVLGAMYYRSTTLAQSMLTFLPAVAQRKVLVSVYGVENETDVEERDFLVDVDTGRTEPNAVSTAVSRDAVLTLTQGAESADPQQPAIPIGHAPVAVITLDTIQVTNVEMLVDFQVASTEDLDVRTDDLETFRDQIGPRVTALASDLSALESKINAKSSQFDMSLIYKDLAEVKAKAGLPATYAQYGADFFLTNETSDWDDTQLLGYDARAEMGIRFPDANADIFEISLFSANDPNASYSNGLLLPAYDMVNSISNGAYNQDIGMSQYGYQTYNLVQKFMHKERLRYGGSQTVCTNGSVAGTLTGEIQPWWLPNFETYETISANIPATEHTWYQQDFWWHDSWKEPYWELETVDHTITGAQIAQTFLVSNDMWSVALSFYVTAKAAAENIVVNLTEVTTGMPDLTKVILHQVYPHTSIVVGWNTMNIVPTFLQRGKRYAIVLTSNANHRIGMSYGQSYLAGTFFYSTDGQYYLGDLMKDMLFVVHGAKFRSSQVTIEFAPINLDGGFRDVDITAASMVPASCALIYEMRPNGSGQWQQLTQENLSALTGAPPLCQFRARFIGTQDIQPGVYLTGSRVLVSRPKTVFKHVSEPQTLATPSTSIFVRLTLERYQEVPHDCTCQLYISGASPSTINPVTTVDEVIDANEKRIYRTFHFTPASTNHFAVIVNATTNSPATIFHIAERLFWAM